MLDNPIIDVAIGLVFFYVTLSLTAIQEIIASLLGLRSRNLKKGIENLIGNDASDVRTSSDQGHAQEQAADIKPELFSTVLIDMISRDKTDENLTRPPKT